MKLRARIGMKICDFGLWVLSLGPKDKETLDAERSLISFWKSFKKEFKK